MFNLRFILVFLVGFAIYFWIDATYFSLIQKEIKTLTQSKAIGHIAAYTVTLIPLLVTVTILHRSATNLAEKMGISRGLFTGIAFAFLSTLPMLIGFAFKFSLNKELSVNTLIINTISSAFFEETIYRAFLFGQLYRFTRLGFLPSVFLGSLLFGAAHLYQSPDVLEAIGIFAITFFGSILFSWIYAEWKFNLWTAIFLHTLMNVYWLIFNADDNALGGTYANIFRFGTVFLAIIGTIIFKKRHHLPMEVSGKKWWMKAKSAQY